MQLKLIIHTQKVKYQKIQALYQNLQNHLKAHDIHKTKMAEHFAWNKQVSKRQGYNWF